MITYIRDVISHVTHATAIAVCIHKVKSSKNCDSCFLFQIILVSFIEILIKMSESAVENQANNVTDASHTVNAYFQLFIVKKILGRETCIRKEDYFFFFYIFHCYPRN